MIVALFVVGFILLVVVRRGSFLVREARDAVRVQHAGSVIKPVLAAVSPASLVVGVGTTANSATPPGSGGQGRSVCAGSACRVTADLTRVIAVVAGPSEGGAIRPYDPSPTFTTAHQFVATESGTSESDADSHGGGPNDQHGDGGRRGESNAGQVQELKDKLNELVKNQGSRSEKDKFRMKIKNLQEEARQAAKGENHSRRPKQ